MHNHCNQKAVPDAKAVHRVLNRMGIEFEELQEGCCAMAGSFDYVKAHNEISIKIAGQHLLPAVRQADPDSFLTGKTKKTWRRKRPKIVWKRAMPQIKRLQPAAENENTPACIDAGGIPV